MTTEIGSKLMRLGLVDSKLAELAFFDIDPDNIIPAIRRARVWYLRYFLEAEPLRRQPVINVFFELPDESLKYVHNWFKEVDRPRKILELSRNTIKDAEHLICEILRTWYESEKIWAQHIEAKMKEFERSSLREEESSACVLLHFNRK